MAASKKRVSPKKKANFLVLLFSFLVLVNLIFVALLIRPSRVNSSLSEEAMYSELEEIELQKMNFQELSRFFTELAETKGAVYAFEILKRAPIQPNIDIHLLGHLVGNALYKQKGLEGIVDCTDDFRNACSHSMVVGLLLERGESAMPDISAACKRAPGGSGAYTMCFHGLGHGALAFASYDLPKAIELCKKTGSEAYGQREYIECVGGSIMEMIAGVHDREAWARQVAKFFRDDDPLYPCTASFMPSEAKSICLVYITPRLFEVAGADLRSPNAGNFSQAFRYCDVLPKTEVENRNACYGGFGKEFVVLAKGRDVRSIDRMNKEELSTVYEWCLLTDDEEGRTACVNSAVNSLYWGGENDRQASIDFCGLISNRSLRENCFNDLISSVAYYIKDDTYKKDFCSELPDENGEVCRRRLDI